MSKSETAIWNIASWMVTKAEEELTSIFTARGLNHSSHRNACDELVERLFDANQGDEDLMVSLRQLSTHPSVQLSGMREAIGYVAKGFSACSSTHPEDWFQHYRDQMFEQKAGEQSTLKRTKPEASNKPSLAPLFVAPQFAEAVAS